MNLSSDDLFASENIFCINLEQRQDRWERTGKAIRDAGFVNVKRFNAVDGKSIKADDPRVSPYLSAQLSKGQGKLFALSPSVVACYLSHYETWKTIVDNKLEYAVIFEDDVKFCDNFKTELDLELSKVANKQVDILFFGYIKIFGRRSDLRVRDKMYGLQASIITLKGAQALVDLALPIIEPLDHHFGSITHVKDDLHIYHTQKPLAKEQDDLGSDIQPLALGYYRAQQLAYALLASIIIAIILVWFL